MMKKFLLRGVLPRLLFCILFLSTFLPHPCVNVLFSHALTSATASTAHTPLQSPLSLSEASPRTLPLASLHCTHADGNFMQNTLPMSATNAKTALLPTVGTYACILSDDTFFYATADEKRGLFLLPKTYYVRLLEYRTDYCKIEYQTDASNVQRLVGYARTEALTFVNYTPARPYLYYTFDLHYKIEDTAQTDSTFLTELTLSCVYYGDYVIGSERYCYVLRGDEFGYVPKPLSLHYEENTEYADYLASLQPDPEPSTSQSDTDGKSSSPAQIAILVAICLLVPVLAALVLKPPRRPPYELDD